MKKAQEMCGSGSADRRAVPEGERRYLDALVRGVYAKRDLAAGEILTHEDVFFAVPLLKGQMSTREFTGGERVTGPVTVNTPLDVHSVEAPALADPTLVALILDRGLDISTARTAIAS